MESARGDAGITLWPQRVLHMFMDTRTRTCIHHIHIPYTHPYTQHMQVQAFSHPPLLKKILKTDPRAFCVVVEFFTTELYTQSFFYFFWDRVSPSCPGWLRTSSVAQEGLHLILPSNWNHKPKPPGPAVRRNELSIYGTWNSTHTCVLFRAEKRENFWIKFVRSIMAFSWLGLQYGTLGRTGWRIHEISYTSSASWKSTVILKQKV